MGYANSEHYHVFELTRQLPRFAMYAITTEPVQPPEGFVTFRLNERVQRVGRGGDDADGRREWATYREGRGCW